MKEFFSAGEMSSLFALNIQTLYYYDSIGLFKPRFRDQANGRRKYEFDQIYELATICYMRKVGYSIEEISHTRSSQHCDTALLGLKKRSAELHRQWEEMMAIDQAIQRKISFIEAELENIKPHEIEIRHYPARRYITIGEEELLYRHNSFYFYPTMGFYEDDKKYFGVYLYKDGDQACDMMVVPDQITVLPEGEYLIGYHTGSYEKVPEAIRHLRQTAPDLKLSDLTISFNILDQFVENSSENYITQIQVMIQS